MDSGRVSLAPDIFSELLQKKYSRDTCWKKMVLRALNVIISFFPETEQVYSYVHDITFEWM